MTLAAPGEEARRPQALDLARLPFGSDPADVVATVRRDGGVILTGVVTRDEVDAINAELAPGFAKLTGPKGAGENNYLAQFAGSRTRRLTHCVKHSRTYRERFVCRDYMADYIAAYLGGPTGSHSLFASQSIEIMPGQEVQQLHRDGGRMLKRLGFGTARGGELMINTLLALTDITEDVGATRIVPGSHLWDDFSIPGNPDDTIPVLMQPGEVFFYTGHVLHGGGANVTADRSRRLIATAWSLPFLTGEEAWPFVFSVDEVRAFPPRLQSYLGFRSVSYGDEEPGALWRVDARPLERVLGFDDGTA